jgi:hypothetical protein
MIFVGSKAIYGQNIVVSLKSNIITAKKIAGVDLVIPIDIDFINTTANAQSLTPTIQIDSTTSPTIIRFNPIEYANSQILNNNITLNFNANGVRKISNIYYLFINRSIAIGSDKVVYLNIMDGGSQLGQIKVNIQSQDTIFSLTNYLEKNRRPRNRVNRLSYVTKVESSNNLLTLSGYKQVLANNGQREEVFLKTYVELVKGETLAISEWSWVGIGWHWKPFPLSLTTVPFKVRPEVKSNGKLFSSVASSGLSNVGFNIDLVKYQMDRYFATGKKSTHKFSFGLWLGPSVEELDSIYTNGANGALGKGIGKVEKSKQLYISTGLTISYSYNDISFVFVPIGYDYATSKVGKTWVYNKERWWGFGIAVSPKIFATILNSSK